MDAMSQEVLQLSPGKSYCTKLWRIYSFYFIIPLSNIPITYLQQYHQDYKQSWIEKGLKRRQRIWAQSCWCISFANDVLASVPPQWSLSQIIKAPSLNPRAGTYHRQTPSLSPVSRNHSSNTTKNNTKQIAAQCGINNSFLINYIFFGRDTLVTATLFKRRLSVKQLLMLLARCCY